MEITKQAIDSIIKELNNLTSFNLKLLDKDDCELYNNSQGVIKGSRLVVYTYILGMAYAIKINSEYEPEKKVATLPKDIEAFLEVKKNSPIDVRIKRKCADRNSYKYSVCMKISIISYDEKELEFMAKVYQLDDKESIIYDNEFSIDCEKIGIIGVESVTDVIDRIVKVINKKHTEYMINSKESIQSSGIIWVAH